MDFPPKVCYLPLIPAGGRKINPWRQMAGGGASEFGKGVQPTENQRDYPHLYRAWAIEGAVASVLDQAFSGFELIVVDDGSTDQTSEVLAVCGDDIRLIRQSNQGSVRPETRGLPLPVGNSSPFWIPMTDGFRETRRPGILFRYPPDALICQTEELWIRNGRRVNPRHRHRKPSGDIFIPSLALCLVSPSAVMMRRELSTGSAFSTKPCRPAKITTCGCGSAAVIRSTSSTNR